jgi:4-aminobutyrate aminotransferase-like enzyme
MLNSQHNSGAEAVENAVRVARHFTGRPNVIALQGGYHGRTAGAATLTTAKHVYFSGQPSIGGVKVAPCR